MYRFPCVFPIKGEDRPGETRISGTLCSPATLLKYTDLTGPHYPPEVTLLKIRRYLLLLTC